MTKSTRAWAVAVLCAAPAFIGWSMLLSHPILQNPWYHDFADQRTIFGVANFWNVVSNAAFLLVAALGLKAFRSRVAFTERWERSAYGLMLAGVAMVAFGSAYYHSSPNSDTLFWDRLPMTIVFMSLFATTIGERIDMRIGRLSLIPLLAIGIASAIYWRTTGDLRFYAAVQFYPMLVIPLLLICRPASYSRESGTVAMIALYPIAKLAELFDHQLAFFTISGGHPWKHVIAAAALLCYVASVARRKKIELSPAVNEPEKQYAQART
jgi:Ceramidase